MTISLTVWAPRVVVGNVV
jgi:N-acetylglucosamine-6-phosphate deacetylase